MRMVQTVFACTVLLICSVAWATVYEWVDTKGVVHLTDDPDNVPAKYRKAMKVRDINVEGNTAPAAGPNTPVSSPEAGMPENRGVLLYGGHNEGWWLSAFRDARDNIKKLGDQIDTEKKDLEQLRRKRALYQKPSDRAAYYALMDQIATDEERVKVLKENLDDLESRADAARVPQDWR